jgi:hypothetical protein
MKIVKVEDLHCDAGWRVNSFLKVTTDEGLVSWSEYGGLRRARADRGDPEARRAVLIGRDPRQSGHSAHLYAATRQAAGEVNQMAIAAIECAGRHQGQGIGRAGPRDAGRAGAHRCSSIGRIAAPTVPAMPSA